MKTQDLPVQPAPLNRPLTRRGLGLALLTALVLTSLLSWFAAEPARAAWTAEVATDRLNLRDEPSTRGNVLAVMTWGETVEILDGPTKNGWYEVLYDGQWGWTFGDYLAFGGVGGGWSERWIDVDRSSGAVTLYEGDAALATYWGSLGYDNSDYGYYATAIGTYYIYAKWKPLAWTSYGQAYITNWVAFDPERNNGFHSWSLDEWGDVIAGGDGPTGGCVALEPWAAAEVFAFAEIGMRVEIHW